MNHRPLINGQLEEKVCGDGPCLEGVFEDDTHLQGLNNSIQVHTIPHRQTYTYTNVHVHTICVGICECGIPEGR